MIYQDLLPDDELKSYAQAINSRARLLSVAGRVSVAHLRDCILESGGLCAWCGESIVGDPFEIDHIQSLGKGGSNTADNLAVACQRCNRQKADKSPLVFAQEVVAIYGRQTPLVARLLSANDETAHHQPRLFGVPPDDDLSR
jgi:5-methylcytosine-specific restriction endonuclease McrA